jgi:hypothetical protein
MGQKLSEDEIEELYQVWITKPTVNNVVKKCNVSAKTVKKYRDERNWIKRIKRVRDQSLKKIEKADISHKVQHAKAGREMWEKGQKRIANATKKEIDIRLAKDMVKDGVAIENEALGDHAPNVVIVLELPKGLVL